MGAALRAQLNFSGTVGVNCYLSPDGAGLSTHYDRGGDQYSDRGKKALAIFDGGGEALARSQCDLPGRTRQPDGADAGNCRRTWSSAKSR